MFVPVLDMLVLIPLAFIVIGPVTNAISNALANGINAALALCPPLAGFAMAALWPVMIMFGVHWGFIPIAINSMMTLGYDPIMPLTVGCNFGIAAACLAVFVKTKNKELKGADSFVAYASFVRQSSLLSVNSFCAMKTQCTALDV